MEIVFEDIKWLFSGIGVFILGLFTAKKIFHRQKNNQKIIKNSFGILAGRDINVKKGK